MINYFMKKYAMSQTGANNLRKAVFSRTILNLTKMFPPMIAFMFIFQSLSDMDTAEEAIALTPQNYVLIILAMLFVMFFVARWDYTRLYTNVYSESANVRVDIANRLKKLPLSYFGKRNISDLAATMMGDMSLYEEIFSHAVPHIYATGISTTIISVLILNYNLKLGLAALWVIPVSLLIFFLSKNKRKKSNEKWVEQNREVLDDLQETIEQIQEIKSYNMEEKAKKQFFEKLQKSTKLKGTIEIVTGVAVAFSGMLLKMGIVTVAVTGAQMLLAGEINIFVYIVFLIMTASIYLPIEWVFSAGGFLGSLFLFITMMFLRLLPGFVMARFALASSTMSHMTSALKKMHFPVVLIIPITVMARFFHTAREDYNQVKDAMYLHGLTNRRLFFHPVKLFEYRMVPLFMVLTKTADDVAVSAMTRGLKIHGKRTYIGESRFCMRDYICFLLMLVLIGFYIGGKYVCV